MVAKTWEASLGKLNDSSSLKGSARPTSVLFCDCKDIGPSPPIRHVLLSRKDEETAKVKNGIFNLP